MEGVLHAYDVLRRPRASQVWDASMHANDIYELAVDGGDTARDVRERLNDMAGFIWRHDIEGDINSAVEILREWGSLPV